MRTARTCEAEVLADLPGGADAPAVGVAGAGPDLDAGDGRQGERSQGGERERVIPDPGGGAGGSGGPLERALAALEVPSHGTTPPRRESDDAAGFRWARSRSARGLTMAEERGSGRSVAPVDGLGAWEGVRPTLWVRVGSGVGAIAYLGTRHRLCRHRAGANRRAESPRRSPSWSATVAFLLAPRWPALARGIGVRRGGGAGPTSRRWRSRPSGSSRRRSCRSSCWRWGSSSARTPRSARRWSCVVVYPLVQLAAGRIGPAAGGLPPLELSRLVTNGFSVAATGVLNWLALRTLARFHAEAEERRTLESRLQNAQRLQVVGELASVAAHDFRNVLGASTTPRTSSRPPRIRGAGARRGAAAVRAQRQQDRDPAPLDFARRAEVRPRGDRRGPGGRGDRAARDAPRGAALHGPRRGRRARLGGGRPG